jgi:hypothetical protein
MHGANMKNLYSILWFAQNDCLKTRRAIMRTSHISRRKREIMTSVRILSLPHLWLWIPYYKIWLHATCLNGGSTFPSRDVNFRQNTRHDIPKDCIFLPFLFPPKTAFSHHIAVIVQLLIVSASHNNKWGFYGTVGIFMYRQNVIKCLFCSSS